MDRHSYVQVLRAVAYELIELHGEWMTDDGAYLDDEVNDELEAIILSLQQFIDRLKPKAA